MDIRSWTDAQLANLENNYLAKGAEVGGKFSLAEVRLEKLRRQPSTSIDLRNAKSVPFARR